MYGEVSAYLSILGGFLAVISMYMIPCLLFIIINPYPWYHWKNLLTVFFGGLFILIGWMAGTITIINEITGSKEVKGL